MVGILEKIVLKNFSVGGKCNLFHHGVVLDCLKKQYLEFEQGNLYGIIGEFGNGGAALSCGITGNTNYYEGQIFIDDKETSIEYLAKNSWYVGNDLYSSNSKKFWGSKLRITKNTIKEQIEYGIQKNNHVLDFCAVQNLFNLSNERVNRNIDYVSGERWKASVAIGFANGRSIFCYPWFNSRDIDHLEEQLTCTITSLLDFGCIVIIPTTQKTNIEKIFNKAHIVLL